MPMSHFAGFDRWRLHLILATLARVGRSGRRLKDPIGIRGLGQLLSPSPTPLYPLHKANCFWVSRLRSSPGEFSAHFAPPSVYFFECLLKFGPGRFVALR